MWLPIGRNRCRKRDLFLSRFVMPAPEQGRRRAALHAGVELEYSFANQYLGAALNSGLFHEKRFSFSSPRRPFGPCGLVGCLCLEER
jgi:hypothetical protein